MPEPSLRLSLPKRLTVLAVGAALALVLTRVPGVAGLPGPARATAAITVFTAWCWITSVLPLPVSSLLPALLLPAAGVVPASVVAPSYFHDVLLLFLGGFILAIALERYGLHRRFALRALAVFGARPTRLVFGFMAVAATLSMFISNTSTALLMLPVAMAVLDDYPEEHRRRTARPLLLGLAYACSIGGVGTPIGTAPNVVLLGQLRDRFPEAPTIPFGTWMIGAVPFVIVFLVVAWFVLTRVAFRIGSLGAPEIGDLPLRRLEQGPRSPEQNRVLGVFCLVAGLWLTRQGIDFGRVELPGWDALLPDVAAGSISDATVAMLGVLLLFILPGDSEETGALLGWSDCIKVPWGILLLLGGGFALARAIDSSGLSAAVGDAVGEHLAVMPPVATVALLVLTITFLTEVTSNTATINVMLPLLFTAAVAAGIHPLLFGLPATFAVSCAFMLPVATPPNAILFSSGRLQVKDMARAGVLLNLVTVVLVTLFTLYWVAPRWGFDLTTLPDWAR